MVYVLGGLFIAAALNWAYGMWRLFCRRQEKIRSEVGAHKCDVCGLLVSNLSELTTFYGRVIEQNTDWTRVELVKAVNFNPDAKHETLVYATKDYGFSLDDLLKFVEHVGPEENHVCSIKRLCIEKRGSP